MAAASFGGHLSARAWLSCYWCCLMLLRTSPFFWGKYMEIWSQQFWSCFFPSTTSNYGSRPGKIGKEMVVNMFTRIIRCSHALQPLLWCVLLILGMIPNDFQNLSGVEATIQLRTVERSEPLGCINYNIVFCLSGKASFFQCWKH